MDGVDFLNPSLICPANQDWNGRIADWGLSLAVLLNGRGWRPSDDFNVTLKEGKPSLVTNCHYRLEVTSTKRGVNNLLELRLQQIETGTYQPFEVEFSAITKKTGGHEEIVRSQPFPGEEIERVLICPVLLKRLDNLGLDWLRIIPNETSPQGEEPPS